MKSQAAAPAAAVSQSLLAASRSVVEAEVLIEAARPDPASATWALTHTSAAVYQPLEQAAYPVVALAVEQVQVTLGGVASLITTTFCERPVVRLLPARS